MNLRKPMNSSASSSWFDKPKSSFASVECLESFLYPFLAGPKPSSVTAPSHFQGVKSVLPTIDTNLSKYLITDGEGVVEVGLFSPSDCPRPACIHMFLIYQENEESDSTGIDYALIFFNERKVESGDYNPVVLFKLWLNIRNEDISTEKESIETQKCWSSESGKVKEVLRFLQNHGNSSQSLHVHSLNVCYPEHQ